MIDVSLLLLCVVFYESFLSLQIGADAMAIIARSQEAMRVLASAQLGDDEKEVFVRRASGRIFVATLRFAAKLALIGLVLYALFRCIVIAFPAHEKQLLESLVSPPVIVSLTVATVGYAWVRKTVLARLRATRSQVDARTGTAPTEAEDAERRL